MASSNAEAMNDVLDATDAPPVYGAAIALAIVVALFFAAVLSIASHGDEQPAADEIAQFGD